MKMRVIDRILLAVYAFLGAALLIGAGLNVVGVRISALDWLIETIDYHLRLSLWAKVLFCALVLVLIIWSVHLLLLSFRREKRKEKGCVSIQNTGDGAVRISLQAMDTLVRKAIGDAEGVLEMKTKVLNHEDSVTVQIDMVLTADSHIPNVTMVMQRNIKRFIEEFSGIAVREVVVLVSEVRETAPAIPAPREEEPAVKAAPVYVYPVSEEPATEAEPVQEEPVTEAELVQEEPAAEAEPAQEEPASEAEPVQEEPATEAEPAQEEPASEAEPVQEEPAAEAEPVQEEPATEAEPVQEEPATEAEPVQEEPVGQEREQK